MNASQSFALLKKIYRCPIMKALNRLGAIPASVRGSGSHRIMLMPDV